MLSQRLEAYFSRLGATPNFGSEEALRALGELHGDSPEIVQGVIDGRIVSKDDACRYWADGLNVAYVDPFVSVITDDAIGRIPLEVARDVRAIGLYVFNGVMTIAMASPDDTPTVDRLGQIAGIPVSPVFALPREVDDAIAVHYSNESRLNESLVQLEKSRLFDQTEPAPEKLAQLAGNPALAQVLNEIVYYAIRERATDIHIEAQEIHSRIRFRVDGNLREILTFSRKLHRSLVSRIKMLCTLDMTETRLPQEGRFSLPLGNRAANLRVSTMPSAYGEKAVARILPLAGQKSMMTLEKMMMSQTILHPFKRLVQNPNGIILVTGPSGSGRTTSLYAALSEINTPHLSISTIEDPIEIELAGVTQSQVNPGIDLKFADLLRALMRQDPDAILIGEIADIDTARIATEAALTGHIVFATLHTNSAPQAISRLIELGVEPYMVAPSVIGVLAQRLAAKICEACKEAYAPDADVLSRYFSDAGRGEVTFYRGRGCPECRGTGYRGRIAIHELLLVTEEIRSLISEGRSAREITSAAEKVGYRPLRYDGLKKVLLGLTTIGEVEHNTPFEWAS